MNRPLLKQLGDNREKLQLQADSIIKVGLLTRFYSSMNLNTAKWEMKVFGFELLEFIKELGANLEYGEFKTGISKYKLSNISTEAMNYLLKLHVEQDANLCLYFNEKANNVFAFNLDKNTEEAEWELQATRHIIRLCLREAGIEPLVYVSGRGYHIWVRIAEPIDNEKIYLFMLGIYYKAMRILNFNEVSTNKVNVYLYPSRKYNKLTSLRLFGSKHIKKGAFTYVGTEDTLLNIAESWAYFEDYMKNKTITKEQFEKACNLLIVPKSPQKPNTASA